MKKLRWFVILMAVTAVGLFARRILCPHPEHWWDNLLYAVHIKHYEEPPEFNSDFLQREEPADYAAHQSSVCEVHHIEMRAEIVPIYYGLPDWAVRTKDGKTLAPPSAPPHGIRIQQFPYAEHSAGGGCCVGNLSPTTARIWICSECERAEQEWRAEHLSNNEGNG